jgi:predicted kinase
MHSDLVRKELLGVAPDHSAVDAIGDAAYSSATTERTYETMLERAAHELSMGRSVVLDATWHDPQQRAQVEAMARDARAELVKLECVAPLDITAARLGARLGARHDARHDAVGSDADVDVARAMARHRTRWDGAMELDTTASLEVTLARARAAVE